MTLTPLADRPDPAPTMTAALPAGWWTRGVALHERTQWRLMSGRSAVTDERLRRWCLRHGPGLARRLDELGLDDAALSRILAGAEPGPSAAKPQWAVVAEHAVAMARPIERGEATPDDWRAAFGRVLAPFVEVSLAELDAAMPPDIVDHAALRDGYSARLTDHVVGLAAPVLVAELHRYRQAGALRGADGMARFASYVRALTAPSGLSRLLNDYPVLARLLGQAAVQAAEALTELLGRLRVDRATLVATMWGDQDPGPLVDANASYADAHAAGRATTVLTFADGRRVLYKPRDPGAYPHLDGILVWLNARVPTLQLRRLNILARHGYGWVEYAQPAQLPAAAAADTFYRRLGALLALLHALHTTDIHCENLIAAGDQPVVVDVETLLHHPAPSELGVSGDPAADLLARSVQRTGLLPLMAVGEEGILDLSGIGGGQAGISPTAAPDWTEPGTDRMRSCLRPVAYPAGRNRPHFDGVAIDPNDHRTALLDGFRLAYQAIEAHRYELLALVEQCSAVPVRLIVRPTWTYQELLRQATQPQYLRDALDRDARFGLLWASDHPYVAQFPRHEIVDLWRGDVPLFAGPAGDGFVWSTTGVESQPPAARIAATVPGLAGTGARWSTGLESAMGKIMAFGEADRQDQEWIISAALASRGAVVGRRPAPPLARTLAGTAAAPERLVAAACAVADQLVARGISDDVRVNWLGLELVEERQWLVLPMGGGLANGYLGVALFLAQVSQISGVARYADVAQRAIEPVPGLLGLLADRPDLVRAVGSGGLYGFGGMAYALARLASLLDDTRLLEWTARTVELAGQASAPSSDVVPGAGADWGAGMDWAAGRAGCLAAMVAVAAMTNLARAKSVARQCADEIRDHLNRVAEPEVDMPHGFAQGAAGIGSALVTYAGVLSAESNDAMRARAAGRRLVARARAHTVAGRPNPAWCDGEAGIALALARLDAEPSNPSIFAPVLRHLTELPVGDDLSLCHGELGLMEALVSLSTVVPEAAVVRRRRAGLILDALDWRGARCGAPGAVATPGFLTGLAGIGYGLLRLACPERVPSVLLLAPHP